jgi:hypothetical protein
MRGALGPLMSVLWRMASEGSPSFFQVKAFSHILYSVYGSMKRNKYAAYIFNHITI